MSKFKKYQQGQGTFLPEYIDDLIDEGDMVRVVNEIIETIDLGELYKQYKGGGASSYNPKMLLKVVVYAYCHGIYSSRQIEEALKQNIHFMWLSAKARIDHATISRFRVNRMASVFEGIFAEVIRLLESKGYIDFSKYFLDGTKIEANANKYSFVWKKNAIKYQDGLRERVVNHLKEIDELNKEEDIRYGDIKPENVTSEEIKRVAEAIDNEIAKEETSTEVDKKVLRKKKSALNKLNKDFLPRSEKYEEQLAILGERNSYSKSDKDATFMRMKEDMSKPQATPKAAYNVQIGTQNQFVMGISLHANGADGTCLKENLDSISAAHGKFPDVVIADAAYGTEENYRYLEDNNIKGVVKYPKFYREQKNNLSAYDKDGWQYDKDRDEYICTGGKRLKFTREKEIKTSTGYIRTERNYETFECLDCPHVKLCCKDPEKGHRTIAFSEKQMRLTRKAKLILSSSEGIALRKKRSVDVETVFGDIKQNLKLRRFVHRGIEKVKMEFGLTALAHNLRKLTKLTKQQKICPAFA